MARLCPLCSTRTPKRFCPALERQICAICCGTKRLTEIRCPSTCRYLSSAKAHPPAVVQRRRERDLGFLLPLMSALSETQSRLLLFFQGITLEHAASALPPLLDGDVAEAASTVAATLETAGKGIIYRHQADSLPAQRLAADFESALQRVVAKAGSRQQALERDAAAALRLMARAASGAGEALAGDEAPVYLKLLGRVMPDVDPSRSALVESAQPENENTSSRLVLPG